MANMNTPSPHLKRQPHCLMCNDDATKYNHCSWCGDRFRSNNELMRHWLNTNCGISLLRWLRAA